MAGGAKRMNINTQERAISPDINRLQAFQQRAFAELMRYACDVSYGTDDTEAAAVPAEISTLTTPMTGEVFGGLLVQPQGGTNDLLVSPGACMVIAPDSGPDDSTYKYARDPGVLTLGTLVTTANPAGSPRFDVVECQWSEVTTETDNRDIFDTSTNLFAAVTVTKAREGRLTYRVRNGVAGSGFPGLASGWMPLAVVYAAAGSTTNNQMHFWDVRPLTADRDFAPSKIGRNMPRVQRAAGRVTIAGIMSGLFEVGFSGYRGGGRIRPGVPLTDADSIDLTAAANQTPGQVPGANALYAVYLLFPNSLPRWARYTDGPAGRVPRSPRGIPVVSSVMPNRDGTPSAALNIPVNCGGGTTTNAICILVGITSGASVPRGVLSDGMQYHVAGTPAIVAGTAVGAGTATFALVDNTTHPANARALYVSVEVTDGNVATVTQAEVSDAHIRIKDGGLADYAFVYGPTRIPISNPTGGTINPKWSFTARIPLSSEYPNNTPGTRTIDLVWSNTNITTAASAASLRINGWELGP